MRDATVVWAFVALFAIGLLLVWSITPTCAPDEVYVRGAFSMVCVKGH